MKCVELNDRNFYYEVDYNRDYRFVKTPEVLISSKRYRGLSLGAKMLYSILADRQGLSLKNKDKYTDEDGKIFLIYTNQSLVEMLNVSERTIIKYKKELVEYSLLFEKRMGQGMPNKIYILKPVYDEYIENTEFCNGSVLELKKGQFKSCKKVSSRTEKKSVQELKKNQSNNTDINKTNINNTDINKTNYLTPYNPPRDIGVERMEDFKYIDPDICLKTLQEQIEAEEDSELNIILRILADVMAMPDDARVYINQALTPVKFVKKRFEELTISDVEKIFYEIQSGKEIKNIRGFVITMAYNTVSNIEAELVSKASMITWTGKVIWISELRGTVKW